MSNPSPTTQDTLFDVREIPCRVKHAQIFQRWIDLPVGSHFVLINDHDPVPLYYQFEAQFRDAFTWEYLLRGPEEYQVKITKTAPIGAPAASSAPAPAVARRTDAETEHVDARGLVPPEPLVTILAALENLAAGRRLRAITDREPCHLFGEAEQRGFRHACSAQPDGSWVTILERA